MNRLWVRLTFAFIAVTLVTVLVVALLSGWNADTQFRHYLERRDAVAQDDLPPGRGRMMGGPGPHMMSPPEQDYLNQLHGTLVIAALAAGGVGALLGLLISRAIAAPLANLANAARDFAAHRWERRAPVQGTTEIAEVAQAFNEMADVLQRAETLRRNLMADITHELRTPLTVMQGNLRALLDGVYPLELKEIASLYDETRLLSRLVADLRELALADAGQLPLNIQTVDVLPILKTSIDQFAAAAETENTQINLHASDFPIISADPDRLAQVLHNLLVNALRHTANGTITIGGEVLQHHLKLSIKDTGEGIAAEDMPYVFDRFYRADNSRSRVTGGTGLGLAIAKAWVTAMGGSVGVNSVPRNGSTFWFTLPLASPRVAHSDRVANPPIAAAGTTFPLR